MTTIHQSAPINQQSDEKTCLESVLTCMLCYDFVKRAQICPTCSKLFCEGCIKNYINNHQPKCPNCSEDLTKDRLVNCHKLSEQLVGTLNRLYQVNTDNSNRCPDHMLINSYYCLSCRKEVCSDCCVISTKHSGHKFSKLNTIIKDFEEKTKKMGNCFKGMKQKIENNKQKRQEEKLDCANEKTNKIKELQIHMRRWHCNIEKKISNKIELMEKFMFKESGDIVKLNQIHKRINTDLDTCPKAKFIQKTSHQIRKKIKEVYEVNFLQNQNTQTKQQNLSKCLEDLQSELIPNYKKKTFILDNYTFMRQKKQCLYSQVFFSNGLEWRLKIYPNGNNQQQNGFDIKSSKNRDRKFRNQSLKSPKSQNCNYLSIFIQLKNGFQKLGRYRHKISIENHNDPNLIISREFESEFQSGECWGYNNFAKIQMLYDEGYVHPSDDSIKISLQVGPPTYYCATLDQQSIINSKTMKIQQNQSIIENLLKKLEIKKQDYENGTWQKTNTESEQTTKLMKITNYQSQCE